MIGFVGRILYELGRRMLGIVPWVQPWLPADDPRMIEYWKQHAA
jgi:antirestriction protein ArdC